MIMMFSMEHDSSKSNSEELMDHSVKVKDSGSEELMMWWRDKAQVVRNDLKNSKIAE
jgi:hypothetical protein